MAKAYRVITDEPQGICVGFEPLSDEYETDEFELVDNDSGIEEMEKFVFISLDGEKAAIVIDESYGTRDGWSIFPEHKDLMIWNTVEDFNIWAEEMGFE